MEYGNTLRHNDRPPRVEGSHSVDSACHLPIFPQSYLYFPIPIYNSCRFFHPWPQKTGKRPSGQQCSRVWLGRGQESLKPVVAIAWTTSVATATIISDSWHDSPWQLARSQSGWPFVGGWQVQRPQQPDDGTWMMRPRHIHRPARPEKQPTGPGIMQARVFWLEVFAYSIQKR